MTFFCDYHMHTGYSSDASVPMEDMIKQSIRLGLTEICLTDHVDYQSDGSEFPFQIDYDGYISELNGLRDKYGDRIKIQLGVEVGLSPALVQTIDKFLSRYPFVFVIGSSHDIDRKDLYIGDFFVGKTKEQAYHRYFEEILENIPLHSRFHVYGHIDYIRRYGPYDDNTLLYEDYREQIDAILKALINHGKGLELNTSGYRYGLNQTHPQLSILKRYRDMGGEIITVGSDAHRPNHICGDFDKAYDILREAGFRAITVFRDGKPQSVVI